MKIPRPEDTDIWKLAHQLKHLAQTQGPIRNQDLRHQFGLQWETAEGKRVMATAFRRAISSRWIRSVPGRHGYYQIVFERVDARMGRLAAMQLRDLVKESGGVVSKTLAQATLDSDTLERGISASKEVEEVGQYYVRRSPFLDLEVLSAEAHFAFIELLAPEADLKAREKAKEAISGNIGLAAKHALHLSGQLSDFTVSPATSAWCAEWSARYEERHGSPLAPMDCLNSFYDGDPATHLATPPGFIAHVAWTAGVDAPALSRGFIRPVADRVRGLLIL